MLGTLLTMGCYGSTVGVNQYYSQICHYEETLDKGTHNATSEPCAVSEMRVQYLGACIALAILLGYVVRIQHLRVSLENSTDTHVIMHEDFTPLEVVSQLNSQQTVE